jgi:hypothetical protein
VINTNKKKKVVALQVAKVKYRLITSAKVEYTLSIDFIVGGLVKTDYNRQQKLN